ncbi:MAG TPA: hypothetical protein VE870_06895, partial [Bacteroidales bacterium]|nr:hypothetical protein [Bacteroidales bacterium]
KREKEGKRKDQPNAKVNCYAVTHFAKLSISAIRPVTESRSYPLPLNLHGISGYPIISQSFA